MKTNILEINSIGMEVEKYLEDVKKEFSTLKITPRAKKSVFV